MIIHFIVEMLNFILVGGSSDMFDDLLDKLKGLLDYRLLLCMKLLLLFFLLLAAHWFW